MFGVIFRVKVVFRKTVVSVWRIYVSSLGSDTVVPLMLGIVNVVTGVELLPLFR